MFKNFDVIVFIFFINLFNSLILFISLIIVKCGVIYILYLNIILIFYFLLLKFFVVKIFYYCEFFYLFLFLLFIIGC